MKLLLKLSSAKLSPWRDGYMLSWAVTQWPDTSRWWGWVGGGGWGGGGGGGGGVKVNPYWYKRGTRTDRILWRWFGEQLYCDRHQIVVVVEIEQTHGRTHLETRSKHIGQNGNAKRTWRRRWIRALIIPICKQDAPRTPMASSTGHDQNWTNKNQHT